MTRSFIIICTLHIFFFSIAYSVYGQTEKLNEKIANAENCKGDFDTCLKLYEDALNLAKSEKNTSIETSLYYKKGRFLISKGEYQEAKICLNNGIAFAEKIQSNSLALIFSALGTCDFMLGDMESSMKQYIKAAEHQQNTEDWANLSYSYINISAALYNLKNYEESLKYLFEADALSKKVDLDNQGTIQGNIALHFYELKDYDSTIIWSKKAIETGKENDEIIAKILGNYSISAAFLKTGEIDSGIKHARLAINEAKEYDFKHYLGEAYSVYAQLLLEKNNINDAKNAIENAINIQKELSNYLGLTQAYKVAGDIYHGLEDFPQSNLYYQNYIQMYDSFLKEDVSTKVVELNKKYKAEERERKLLQQELRSEQFKNLFIASLAIALILIIIFISFRRRQKMKFLVQEKTHESNKLQAWIKGESAERNRVSKELHDGVASLIGAAKMHLETSLYLENEKKENQIKKVIQILTDTHQDIRSVAHDLMPIAIQNQGLWLAIKNYASLCLEEKETVIEIDNALYEIKGNPLKELTLYRIIQEVIQNIIKHANANKVQFKCIKKNSLIEIHIIDNGIGYDYLNENSFGIKGLKDKVQYLNATINLIANPNQGSDLYIVIPVNSLYSLS